MQMMSEGKGLNIIIAGAPASGKGTQCEIIKEKFKVVHLSTGDILRAAVKEKTELGIKAKAFMDAGQLVPDDLIIDVVSDRLRQSDCQNNGWLLDGFPRTKSQADALSRSGMVPDCLILLDVPEEVLVERVTGRRTDPLTGKIYHLKFNPPENDEIMSRLVQRSDDTEEKIKVRFKEFLSHIDAIKACYSPELIKVIDGKQSSSSVTQAVIAALDEIRGKKMRESQKSVTLPNNNKSFQTTLGMGSLFLIDKAINILFKSNGISFPSSLAAMSSVFIGLSTLYKFAPKSAEFISKSFDPAVSFIKVWLPLFFVPPLVVLPLKMNLIKGMELQLIFLLLAGGLSSFTVSGLVAQTLTMQGSSSTKRDNGPLADSGSSPLPSLPPAKYFALCATLLLFVSRFSPAANVRTIAAQAFGIPATITAYLLGQKVPASIKKIAHPVLTCSLLSFYSLAMLGFVNNQATRSILSSYFGSDTGLGAGDFISSFLGPAIVSFGFQLYQFRSMIFNNLLSVTMTTLISALFGILSSAGLAKALRLAPKQTSLSTLTRCITSPLALAGAGLIGADKSLAAFLVVVTGLLGASFGEAYLEKVSVKDKSSVGLAMGSSAHGLGMAAVAKDPIKFASAVVGMSLTGVWTVSFLAWKPFRDWIVKTLI